MSRLHPRRWVQRATIAIGCVAAIAVVSGASVETVLRRREHRLHPAPGRLVDIGGRRLQLDCRGAGSPTVVLESGLDDFGSKSWAAVHDPLARTTRVCAYSRAGILWSDPAPGPFDARRAARDLHTALANAGERAPWVLVGHSLGGTYAMLFTHQYGAEVRGLVFVDASHPDQVARLEAATGASMRVPTGALAVGSALAWTGVVRLVPDGPTPPTWPAVAVDVARAYRPHSVTAVLAEARALDATFAAAAGARSLGDRPLVVLTAAAPLAPDALARNGPTRAQEVRKQSAWRSLQVDQATWSSDARHEVVPDASHFIQFDRPDVVIRGVRDVVARVRARAAPDTRAAARSSP
jgi:pimeloyl-ACP methyl ester carboxylesterase